VQQIEPCEYVALSYVWGKSSESSLRTEKANVNALSIAGARVENKSARYQRWLSAKQISHSAGRFLS
jgi:hypothetical protein